MSTADVFKTPKAAFRGCRGLWEAEARAVWGEISMGCSMATAEALAFPEGKEGCAERPAPPAAASIEAAELTPTALPASTRPTGAPRQRHLQGWPHPAESASGTFGSLHGSTERGGLEGGEGKGRGGFCLQMQPGWGTTLRVTRAGRLTGGGVAAAICPQGQRSSSRADGRWWSCQKSQTVRLKTETFS